MSNKTKSVVISLLIIVFVNILEQLLTGDGVAWFIQLKKPDFLVSLNFFYVVAAFYSIICFIILYRSLNKYLSEKHKGAKIAFISIIILMLTNSLWNYFFMGLQNTANGFYGMVLFLPIVLFSLSVLWKSDKFSFWLLSVYAVWLVYDIIWTYALWELNG